ncbi:MAG: VWA domain-containing protein [Bacteroidota bacterium]
MKKILYIIGLLVLSNTICFSQESELPLTRILFVYDASQSMLGRWETGVKMDIARKLLCEMVDSLQGIDNIEIALRIYGHQSVVPPQDCSDTRLEIPFGKNNGQAIKTKLYNINAKGTTPIANSLEQAAKDFPECTNCRNVIILITDGIEACDGDPCAVSLALQKQGIILKPFVIGVGLDLEFKSTFECVGEYFDAANEKRFKEVLGIVISQALNNTTLQVNLLDINGLPTETDVNMTFIDAYSGNIKHNYIHTINHKGNPDTLILDPFITYNMIVHTIPQVKLDSIKLVPGKHTIVGVDAPQGYLLIKSIGNIRKDIPVVIRLKDQMNTLNIQYLNQTEKYIVGNYDIEVLTLPRIYVPEVEVKQSHTTTVEIPIPGMTTFLFGAPGYGSVYVDKDNKLEWIYNLKTDVTSETINLQPGRYKVVYRARNAKKTLYTFEESFKVSSGQSVAVKLK